MFCMLSLCLTHFHVLVYLSIQHLFNSLIAVASSSADRIISSGYEPKFAVACVYVVVLGVRLSYICCLIVSLHKFVFVLFLK